MPQESQSREESIAGSNHTTVRCVIFGRPDDPDALADVLAQTLHLHRIDARIRVHSVPGLLSDHLDPASAADAVRRIRDLGIHAVAIPNAEIPHLDHPDVIHRVACVDEGLEIGGLTGAPRGLVNWHDLSVVSLGWVPLDVAHHYVTEATVVVSSAPHTTTDLVNVRGLSGAELWLWASHPDRVYRLDQDHMNYEYLGDRMRDSGAANFPLLLTDIASRAPHAYLTPATHAFLNREPVERYRFADSDALKRETLLHILLHREQAREPAGG